MKQLLVRAMVSKPVLPAVRRWTCASRAAVLMYHELGDDDAAIDAWTVVKRGAFLAQVEHLRAHYDIVSIDEALARRHDRPGRRPLAVITFDDGDANNHDILLPIVEREKIPVAIFVATGHICDGKNFWFDRVVNAVQGTTRIDIDLTRHGLGTFSINTTRGQRNWVEIQRLLAALKTVEPPQRERLTDEVVAGAAAGADPHAIRPLTIEQVRALGRSPYVTIGAHSHCHNLLTQIPLDQARESILQSRSLLQQWSGQPVRHFAYPNGDHEPRIANMVAGLGFDSAMATTPGLWDYPANPMSIPRIGVGRYDALDTFKFNLLGLQSLIRRVRRPAAAPSRAVPA